MLVKIEQQNLFNLSLILPVSNQDTAKKAKKAFEVTSALRKAGAKNLMYCLSFRLACTSSSDLAAVQKVGVTKVKQAYDYFAKEFGKL
jgi:hypothetical protein